MTQNSKGQQNISVNVPIGVLVGGVLAGVAAAAYVLISGNQQVPGATQVSGTARSAFRRVGLLTLVAMIENDATRKVLVAILRALARRA